MPPTQTADSSPPLGFKIRLENSKFADRERSRAWSIPSAPQALQASVLLIGESARPVPDPLLLSDFLNANVAEQGKRRMIVQLQTDGTGFGAAWLSRIFRDHLAVQLDPDQIVA